MDKRTYIITFNNGSVADANLWASELKEHLLDATPDVSVQQRRNNPYSLDLGTTLVVVLSAPAVTIFATALGNWLILNRSRQVSIDITTPQGHSIVKGLTAKEARELAERMLKPNTKE